MRNRSQACIIVVAFAERLGKQPKGTRLDDCPTSIRPCSIRSRIAMASCFLTHWVRAGLESGFAYGRNKFMKECNLEIRWEIWLQMGWILYNTISYQHQTQFTLDPFYIIQVHTLLRGFSEIVHFSFDFCLHCAFSHTTILITDNWYIASVVSIFK